MSDVAKETSAIRLASPRLENEPFRYFLTEDCLADCFESDLLDWFETAAPWQLVETDFYEQYEFSMLHVDLPQHLDPIRGTEALRALRLAMGQAFGVKFEDRMTVVAHKLIPGQRIAIHNDFLDGAETHRLTVQLNRGLSDEDGGFFMLFNSFEAADIHKILRPLSGSALGFEIGPHSYHAISKLHGRERYTIVYSFYADRSTTLLD